MEHRIYLVDGHNLLYKAHFTFIRNPLINTKGINTSVSYGVTSMLHKLLKTFAPTHLIFIFDSPEPTFRKELFTEYKITRPPMPLEIREQLSAVKKIIQLNGINIYEKPGFEADDIIGTIAYRLDQEGHEVIIISGDKDLLQLVTSRTNVLAPKSGVSELELFDRNAVYEKYSIYPEQIPDFIALWGDTADNIPGVEKVGEKTAATLLQRFVSVENMLANSDKIEPQKLRERIENARADIELGKFLATIRKDIELDVSLSLAEKKAPSVEELQSVYRELEFTVFLNELPSIKTKEQRRYEIVTTREQLEQAVQEIKAKQTVVYNLETTSENPMEASLVGISLCSEPMRAWYIPIGHETGETQLTLDIVQQALSPILRDPAIKKIGHDIKYDWVITRRYGMELAGLHHDTMIASYVLDPSRQRHSLEVLSSAYLNINTLSAESLLGKGAKAITMAQIPVSKAVEYAGETADITFRLAALLEEKIQQEGTLYLFKHMEMPLIEVLVDMEMTGIKLDTERLSRVGQELHQRMSLLQESIYAETGEVFNINSPKQLNDVLFKKLNYPTKGLRKTTHGWSTDEEALRKLVFDGLSYRQLPELILDYRMLSKLCSTYVEALPQLINPVTRRLHTSFNQTVTETGRLSSSNPNLQNIPIKGEWGPEMRAAFIAGHPGWKLVSADYSQIELRILAHISGDETMIDFFHKGYDIHTRTACELFLIEPDQVTQDQRRIAKTINFGIDYGMTEYGLSQRLNISVKEAKDFIDRYFRKFPKIRTYIETTCHLAESQGFVTTLLNRRRSIPEINDPRKNVKEAACRRAINMPIQGTAADLIKIAMIHIHEQMKQRAMKSRILLQIHDELVFEALPEEIYELKELIRREMEGALQLKVPLVVEIRSGDSWREAH